MLPPSHLPPEINSPNPPTLTPLSETPFQNSPDPGPTPKRFPWINLLLFGLTIYTTLLAGAGVDSLGNSRSLSFGISFSMTLMAILLTHEMGHYLASRYHRVEASLPYFIPAPPFFLIGTFGAFIRMTSPITSRKALLDIGAAGPIAGFIITIPALILGLSLSSVMDITHMSGLKLGDSLIFRLIAYVVIGPIPEGYGIGLHPIAFAAWFGIFVTALNLIPIGQLDGGHIVYAIFGRFHRKVSLGMVPILVAMGFFGWPGWYLWAVLPLLFGIRHPPLVDPHAPLDQRRKIIGWISLAILVLSFTPVPISF